MPTGPGPKATILVLMAGTEDRSEARIGAEAREIRASIQAASNRDAWSVVVETATRPQDVARAVREHAPDVVHFCGHGEDGVLYLLDDEGDGQPVTPGALAELIKVSGSSVRLVVFDVCRSLGHAEAVSEYVDVAIGVGTALGDRAAICFARSFYQALASGVSVGRAHNEAVAVIRAAGLAVAGAPELRCREGASAAELCVPAVVAPRRTAMARWGALLVPMAVLAVVAIMGIAMLLWPRLSVPRFRDGAGVVVARRWLAGEDVRAAHADLARALGQLGEHYVHAVELSILGASDRALVDAAHEAGASLVVVVDSGPELRILPIPGTWGSALLEHIPPLPVARAETRDKLAPILFALAWSAVKEPATLAQDLDIAISAPEHVGPAITLLAIYLRQLVAPWDESWKAEARGIVRRLVQQCGSLDSLADWSCSMAHYLHYGLLEPAQPEAERWLASVRDTGPGAVGDAAVLEIMQRQCRARSEWVADAMQEWLARWGQGDCRRLAMMVPASCLEIENQWDDPWLHALANPQDLEQYAHCGDLRARVLAQKATLLGDRGRWSEAAELHARAAELAPASTGYVLEQVAALLHVEPRPADLATRVAMLLDIERIEPRQRLHAELLRWLATGDHIRARDEICARYRDVAMDRRAIPELGHLGARLCRDQAGVRCRVYRILSAPRTAAAADALCSALGNAAGGE